MATGRMGIEDFPATAIVAKAQGIHERLMGNALFPSPMPALATFKADIDALAAANAAANVNGGRSDFQAKRETLRVVKADIKRLLAYVQLTSDGDADMILSSGFELVKHGGPIGELAPPANLQSRFTTMVGRVNFCWKGEKGAEAYHVYRSTGNDPFRWELIGTTTKRSFKADGLVTGGTYWFAVTAVGAAGETSKSEPLLARAA